MTDQPRTAAGRAFVNWMLFGVPPDNTRHMDDRGELTSAILAIEAEATAAVPLDVERLAKAIEALKKGHYQLPNHIERREDVAWIPYLPTAEKIAAEYARLASAATPGATDET